MEELPKSTKNKEAEEHGDDKLKKRKKKKKKKRSASIEKMKQIKGKRDNDHKDPSNEHQINTDIDSIGVNSKSDDDGSNGKAENVIKCEDRKKDEDSNNKSSSRRKRKMTSRPQNDKEKNATSTITTRLDDDDDDETPDPKAPSQRKKQKSNETTYDDDTTAVVPLRLKEETEPKRTTTTTKKRKRKRRKYENEHETKKPLDGLILAISTLDRKDERHDETSTTSGSSSSSYRTVSEECISLGASVTGQVHKRIFAVVCNRSAVLNLTQRVRKAWKKSHDVIDVGWIRRCKEMGRRVPHDEFLLNDLVRVAMEAKEENDGEGGDGGEGKEEENEKRVLGSDAFWSAPISLDCCCVCHDTGRHCEWCLDCNVTRALKAAQCKVAT